MEGKEVVVIEVVSGPQKPYTLSGAIYVRQGPNSQKILSVEQMRDFFQQSSRIYFDESSCYEFDSDKDIDDVTFEEFRIDAGLSRAASREQIISNLRLLSVDGVFKNGAVLFFGKSPEDFIDKAVLRCVAFDGTNKTYIVDDKIYTGSLISQYNYAIQWLKTKLDISYEIEGTGPRKEHWEIPRTVFKEAIINALTHRDYYDKGARLTIELFTDRVEITNPGGLVSAISKKEFGFKSHSRNPLIFGLFERMNMVEQIGSGINRMRRAMEVANLSMPIFKTEGMFTVVLNRPITKSSEKGSEKSKEDLWFELELSLKQNAGNSLNKSKWVILKLINENNSITIANIALMGKLAVSTVEKNIRVLKELGLLERLGADRGGYWKINANIKSREKSREKSKGNSWSEIESSLEQRVGDLLNKSEWKILKLINENNNIKIADIALIGGLAVSTVEKNIRLLKKLGLLERIGAAKGGYWKINTDIINTEEK